MNHNIYIRHLVSRVKLNKAKPIECEEAGGVDNWALEGGVGG
jgi:hypothetical protein